MEPIPQEEMPPIISIHTCQPDRMVGFYRDGLGLAPLSAHSNDLATLGGFGVHVYIDSLADNGKSSIHGNTPLISRLSPDRFEDLSQFLSKRGVANKLVESRIEFTDPDGNPMVIHMGS
jgi:hypothetical protein